MIDKKQDPNLQAPQEANTTKHFNFLESEEATDDSSSAGTENDSDNDSPTKKAWEELRQEQQNQQSDL
jgi:hypothetical protein